MSTPAERAQARREQRIEHINEQVRDGSLTIRVMTDEERARWAPDPRARGAERPSRGRAVRR